jgi:hypothetical protein
MSIILTFIIPVLHQDNSNDWGEVKKNLAHTIRSIAAQTNDNWKAVIVANSGADLPQLPQQVDVKWVDFPPKRLPDKKTAEPEIFYDAVRIDKGRRVLAGMLHAGTVGHFMVVDYDDFVSSTLTSFVAGNQSANGWYIKDGYVWGSGGHLLYLYSDFSNFCGTSHIIRADLYKLPATYDSASEIYIRRMLGSHIMIGEYFEKAGTPLARLPFIGAVYRIGYAGATSKSSGLISHFLMHRWLVKRPREFARRLLRLRFLTNSVRREFFGERARMP